MYFLKNKEYFSTLAYIYKTSMSNVSITNIPVSLGNTWHITLLLKKYFMFFTISTYKTVIYILL